MPRPWPAPSQVVRTTAASRPDSTPVRSIRRPRRRTKSQEALCLTLASQIEALNTEGVPDKVSKAAAKKYKLKSTDLTKADELNKANTEFQGKCSSYPPRVAATAPVEPVTATKEAPAKEAEKTAAAKTKPPVPAQKSVAAAMATQETTQASSGPVAVGAPQ